jgi:hypothetical protein
VKYGAFEHVRGQYTLYSDKEGDALSSVRFLHGRIGEDPQKLIDRFSFEEGSGDFSLMPLLAWGQPPRKGLCSPRSLTEALKLVRIEPGSREEQIWKECCEHHGVPWPKRLQAQATKAA